MAAKLAFFAFVGKSFLGAGRLYSKFVASMHRFIIIITIMLCGLGAKSAELWPFSEVNNRLVLSVNGGYHFDSGVAVMGFGATIKGFHITIGGVGSCKLPDGVEPSGKNTASAMVQLGYQIPVVKQFRFIPVIGTAAVGKIIYDKEGEEFREEDEKPKTRLKMKYRFDYGIHFVFNHRALIVNAAVTRYTVFGGIGIQF